MGKWLHKLENLDQQSGQADCEACGVVQCVWKKRWRCPIAVKEQRGKGTWISTFRLKFIPVDPVCEICSKSLTTETARVDHDHKICNKKGHACSKCFRGILCAKCNTGLGALGDSIEGLQRAMDYLTND